MSYRKVDVDFEDEEDVSEEHRQLQATRSPAEIESQINAKINAVRLLISRGNYTEALISALDNPPVGKDPQSAKDKNTQLVMDALLATKIQDISGIIKVLSDLQIDILMKYVYKGMAFPDHFNATTLLNWHEKTLEVGGLGSIVRVLTDRQCV